MRCYPQKTNLRIKTQKAQAKALACLYPFIDVLFKGSPQVSAKAGVQILNAGIFASEGGDKSAETHVLIKRDQQCVRGVHTDARYANAQSQSARYAVKKSFKLRAEG